MGIVSGMTASQVTGATKTPQPVPVVSGFPGFDVLKKGIESGAAKLVTVYPKQVARNGYLETDYYTTPTTENYLDPETGRQFEYPGTQMLSINGKLYKPTNDWGFSQDYKTVQTGSYLNEDGQVQGEYTQVPSGYYRLRARADNNVFDDLYFGADPSGTLNSYSKQFQSGSNGGGFFGSSFLGNIANDLVNMAKTTAPVWMPAVSAGISSALAPASTAASTAASAADIAALADVGMGTNTSLLQQLASTAGTAGGLEALSPDAGSLGAASDLPIADVNAATVTPVPDQTVLTPQDIPSVPTSTAATTPAPDTLPISQQDPFAYTPTEAVTPAAPDFTEAVATPVPDQTVLTPTEIPSVPSYTAPTDMGPITAEQAATQADQLAQELYPYAEAVPRPISTQDPFSYTAPTDMGPITAEQAAAQADQFAQAFDPYATLPPSPSDYLEADAAQTTANDYYAANAGTGGDYLEADAAQTAANDINAMGDVGMNVGEGADINAMGDVGMGPYGTPTTVAAPGLGDILSKFLKGTIGSTGLTGAGALAGLGGLAGLMALIKSDSDRYGTPGRTPYTGSLSQMRFSPSAYQATTPNPAMFRPQGGVTTVADQIAAQQAAAASPFAQLASLAGGQQNDAMAQMAALAGLNFAKGGSTSKKPEYTSKPKLASMDPWTRAAAEYQNAAYRAQSPVAPTAAPTGPQLGRLNLKAGGELGSYSDGGRMLKGPGDGMSDSIPATIGNKRPARLADGEFVIPADVVSHLGNGSTEAGARELYKMMDKVRQARTGNKKQGKQINPGKFLPK